MPDVKNHLSSIWISHSYVTFLPFFCYFFLVWIMIYFIAVARKILWITEAI